jgi:hypothetical protein
MRMGKRGARMCKTVWWARNGLQDQPKGSVRVAKDCESVGDLTVKTKAPRTKGGRLIDQKQLRRSSLVKYRCPKRGVVNREVHDGR